MRLINKLSLITLSLSLLGATLSPIVVRANSDSNVNYVESKSTNNNDGMSPSISQDLDTSVLNKYISVENNQFVLKLPTNLKISNDLKNKALSEISVTNSIIKNQNLKIDPKTLIATDNFTVDDNNSNDDDGISFRSYGKNGVIKYGWNYARIGFDAGLTKDIVTAGVSGVAGYLSYIASGPGAAAVVSAVSAVVGNHIHIKNGTYVDYNVFTHKITRYGWQ
ncbi:hypothetical protein MOO44_00885 (plasmid) [Nicoliella spurrieriana]|uniref:Uncharacterized protein n=1 Tax=Nicoliella spurrieriana TaxID=2925830 RepID=A0A976RR14_9LACO|nr:hypothetical protein [Nicoliella spurrieriana]UQS86227.1 hypothetical protein MOO44_00885 [Nicoliella spurrieriana]